MTDRPRPEMTISLIGGLRRKVPAAGDYRFFGEMFCRLPAEIKAVDWPSRFMIYQGPTQGDEQLTFMGLQVSDMAAIPDRMLGVQLSDCRIKVVEADGNACRRGVLTWRWLQCSDGSAPCPWIGEFDANLPLCGSVVGTGLPIGFDLVGHCYFDPGQLKDDDRIELVEYDAAWPELYRAMADELSVRLGGDMILDMAHIGSTAVPGMSAKPIIDIMLKVPSFAAVKPMILSLFNDPCWEYWWYKDRITLIHRDRLMGRRLHHLHCVEPGPVWDSHLAFRDELKRHRHTAGAYLQLKQSLAADHVDDRERYTEGKSAFIQQVLAQALGRR